MVWTNITPWNKQPWHALHAFQVVGCIILVKRCMLKVSIFWTNPPGYVLKQARYSYCSCIQLYCCLSTLPADACAAIKLKCCRNGPKPTARFLFLLTICQCSAEFRSTWFYCCCLFLKLKPVLLMLGFVAAGLVQNKMLLPTCCCSWSLIYCCSSF